jgi:uracil-DNA glycosylase
MHFLFNQTYEIHPSWDDFISNQSAELAEIEKKIENNYTPTSERILRFLNVDLAKIKVIILGQDPYPQKGVATGRAFEVGTLKSWGEKFNNVSLKNIVRAIYKAEKKNIVKYSQIINSELNNSFFIHSPQTLFQHWEEHGVLLLNTSFTCEIGKPGSHKKIWNQFSQELLKFINEKNGNILWFLWGDHAMKATEEISIKEENKIASFHPMMCYDRENDFLYTTPNCFEKTWDLIDWTGFRDKKVNMNQTLF